MADLKTGYSSRCKLCNCEGRTALEKMHREGATLPQIVETAREDYGLSVSAMAISRHMREHFDVAKVAREKYMAKQQIKESAALIEGEAEKVLSEVEMLDAVARGQFETHQQAKTWLMNLLTQPPVFYKKGDKKGQPRPPDIPDPLVKLIKGAAEEVRQALKTKMELMGLQVKGESETDLAEALIQAWGMLDGVKDGENSAD